MLGYFIGLESSLAHRQQTGRGRPTKKTRRILFCHWTAGHARGARECCERWARGAARHAITCLWKEMMKRLLGEHCQWSKSTGTRGSRQLSDTDSTRCWPMNLDTWLLGRQKVDKSFKVSSLTSTLALQAAEWRFLDKFS